MSDKVNPPCPTCGNKGCQQVSERIVDSSSGFFAKPPGAAKEIIYVLRCSCGTAFTHSVRMNDEGPADA
jgi:hypothetical protein